MQKNIFIGFMAALVIILLTMLFIAVFFLQTQKNEAQEEFNQAHNELRQMHNQLQESLTEVQNELKNSSQQLQPQPQDRLTDSVQGDSIFVHKSGLVIDYLGYLLVDRSYPTMFENYTITFEEVTEGNVDTVFVKAMDDNGETETTPVSIIKTDPNLTEKENAINIVGSELEFLSECELEKSEDAYFPVPKSNDFDDPCWMSIAWSGIAFPSELDGYAYIYYLGHDYTPSNAFVIKFVQ